MKKTLLLFVAFLSMQTAFSQFYISGQGGYSMAAGGILTGTSLNESMNKATNHYGSYGEGANAQLKFGYHWNKMFGVELGFGYLWGADQNVSTFEETEYGLDYMDGTAEGKAAGLNIALVYNFNEHFYGKIGVITKLGGRTQAEFTSYTQTPLSPLGVAPIMTEGVNDYHGRPPLGFTGVFGYRHSLGGNWHAFAELEYLGINVRRNDSEFQSLSITTPATPAIPAGVLGPDAIPAIPAMTWNLGDAPMNHPIFGTIAAPGEISYEDSLPVPNPDPSKTLSSVVAYSSFGLNIGVTYTFNRKK